jgi:hypothetical protein
VTDTLTVDVVAIACELIAARRRDDPVQRRIRELVASAPPLTQAQRERLAWLLFGTPG